MKNTVDIISKRLILRKIKSEDYKAIYNCWTSDFEVSKYVTWNPHKSSEKTKKLVNFWLNEYNQEHTYRWIVEKKETHEIIGMIDVINKNLQYMTAEVGYCYGSKYWGNGYASEALTEVINYLHNIGFITVYAQHFESNKASGKVMQKCGMKYEGTLRERYVDPDGIRNDLLSYSITKDEYKKLNDKK